MAQPHHSKLLSLAAIGLLVTAMSCGKESTSPEPEPRFVAHISQHEAPIIDGSQDNIWERSEGRTIPVDDGQGNNGEVHLRALTDSTYFYLLAVWEDSTLDITPDRIIAVDSMGGYARGGGQDFFCMILADQSGGENNANCAEMCHFVTDEDSLNQYWEMYNNGVGIVDSWIWMSGQTNPVGWTGAGTLEDLHYLPGDTSVYDVSVQPNPVWEANSVDLLHNQEPKWMHRDSIEFTGNFLYRSEAIPWKPVFFDESAGFLTWPYLSTIPGYILADAVDRNDSESRWEVEAKGAYDDNTRSWTLEIKRKMNTGHSDDIAFVLGQEIRCSIGIKSNRQHNKSWPHLGSGPFTVVF